MNARVRTLILSLAVVAAALAAYSGSFDNGFIWDDPIILEQQIASFKTVHDLFVPPLGIPQFGMYYYRPIVIGSFLVDQWFTGPRPMELPPGATNPFHVSVVFFHSLVCLTLFFLARRMLRGAAPGAAGAAGTELAAFAAAMLYAVHPILTEGVCWMAGRADVMAGLGVVSSLAFFVRGRQTGRAWPFVAAGVCFLFGLLCKETAVGLLLAIPFLDRVAFTAESAAPAAPVAAVGDAGPRKKKGSGRAVPLRVRPAAVIGWAWRYLPFVISAVVYWSMRRADLHRGDKGTGATSLLFSVNLTSQRSSLVAWITDLVGAVGFYIRKVLAPVNLNAFLADVPHDPLTMILGAAGLAAGIGAIAWSLSKRARRESILPALVALFFATIAPCLAIATFSISETPVAERYLYIPAMFVCIGAAWAALRGLEAVRARAGAGAVRAAAAGLGLAAAVLFASFTWATSARNETWRDDEAFWLDAVNKEPRQGLPHLHLGLVYDKKVSSDPAEQKRFEQLAEDQFRMALDETKTVYDAEGRSIAWNNLANVFLGRGEYDRSVEAFRKAIAMRPEYHTPYYGLALVNYRQALEADRARNYTEAQSHMQQAGRDAQSAIDLNPRYTKAFLLLGNIQSALGNDAAARQSLQRVMQLEPGSSLAGQAETSLKDVNARAARGTSTP